MKTQLHSDIKALLKRLENNRKQSADPSTSFCLQIDRLKTKALRHNTLVSYWEHALSDGTKSKVCSQVAKFSLIFNTIKMGFMATNSYVHI